MRVLAVFIVLMSQSFLGATASAQQADPDQLQLSPVISLTATKSPSRYNNSVNSEKDQPRNGRVWLPGGSPMTLFTQVPLVLNHVELPVGAYSMYVILNKKDWTLIVSKNVTNPKTYDENRTWRAPPWKSGGAKLASEAAAGFVCSRRSQAVQHPALLRK